MAVSKTRDLLVDVARRLFAQEGVEKTTMNDIAVASHKGRRTLYTYFKSKDEIYYAIVESELETLSQTLWQVVSRNMPPEEKMTLYIYTRLEAIKDVVARNGSLKAEFFKDISKVESVRRSFDRGEVRAIEAMLLEGIEKGVFCILSVPMTASIIHHSLKGLEVPYIRESVGQRTTSLEIRKQVVMDFLFNGIRKKGKSY